MRSGTRGRISAMTKYGAAGPAWEILPGSGLAEERLG